MKKTRVFYLAWTPPSKQSGATLAMRRHLLEHDDFDVFVATSGVYEEEEVPTYMIRNPAWLQRISKTRFWRLVRNFEMLFWSKRMDPDLVEAARNFSPDVIVTVTDLTVSEMALKLSRKLGVPLVANFQDWWPRGQFYYAQEKPYAPLVPLFERRFHRLCKESQLVFCTSEGMKAFLGDHPNSHVLYPIGANTPIDDIVSEAPPKDNGKFRLIYTGTAFGLYGKMLRQLAHSLKDNKHWELVIYGNRPDWPEEELKEAEASGLYRGFLQFELLQDELKKADACLSVMSFDPTLETMMRTSFTTKVLDYCSAGRPVIMWGPDYCSPVRLIQRKQAGIAVTSPNADGVVAALATLQESKETRQSFSKSALQLAREELSHGSIHNVFVQQIQKLVGESTAVR